MVRAPRLHRGGREFKSLSAHMKIIHKIAAVVIKEDKFLMVRKHGKEIWTSLGGHMEAGETEQQALIREAKEEMGCQATIIRKLGDFEALATFDDATVRLSTYLVSLDGPIVFNDPELAEYRFIGKDYSKEGIKLPESITKKVIPHCIKNGLLKW